MCTAVRFTDTQGNPFFGRNLDWTFDFGEQVLVVPQGFKPATPFGATPVVEHAFIGMGVIGDGQPLMFDAANEFGLAVAGLNFPGYAGYATDAVDGCINVTPWEFPMWVCARHASVAEVREGLNRVAIVDKQLGPDWPTAQLHWIVSDAADCIIVEYTPDGMQVFDNKIGVLANQPGFGWHTENLRNYLNVGRDFVPAGTFTSSDTAFGPLAPFGAGSSQRGLPGDYSSPSRFVRAAYVNASHPAKEDERANVSRMFHTLQQVAMVEGSAIACDGRTELTLYTSCYSAPTRTYYYNTYDDMTLRSACLSDYLLDPAGEENPQIRVVA